MADPVSYLRLLEEGEQINYLLKSPELSDDEKEELMNSLEEAAADLQKKSDDISVDKIRKRIETQ